MNDYVVLDLECPNRKMNQITAIAIHVIKNHQIVNTKYTLINPEDDDFDPFIINLTGITPEMVKNSPTFKEYWPEIEDLLRENVIVGHNITHDLNAISKTLSRYNIPVPSFDFCCTLRLSRKFLKLSSYKLFNIAKSMKIEYNPHRADEDAKATYKLYEYLDNKFKISDKNIKHYVNIKLYNQEYDKKQEKNINNLYGILRLLNYKQQSTQKQLKLIEKWVDENKHYNKYNLFDDIIYNLEKMILKNEIEKQDLKKIYKIVTPISKSEHYTREELKTQILQGIIKAIIHDKQISYAEIDYLNRWLKYNKQLEKQLFYNNIKQIIHYDNEEDFKLKEHDIHEKLEKIELI